MQAKTEDLLPALAGAPSDRQRLFTRYFTGTLIDLVVLGLFDEYSSKVFIHHSFTIALLAALLLQILLKVTIAIEHRVGSYFKSKPGRLMVFLRFFCAWLILFGSKFVILEALSFAFGETVRFEGALHGLIALIVVVVVMIAAEELVVRFYRRLA